MLLCLCSIAKMNKLNVSGLKLLYRSPSFASRKFEIFENCMNFSSKTTDNKELNKPDKKKDSKPVYITLYGTDGIPVTSNLESAVKLSKRRNLKLVKISDYDSIRQTPVYKLLTSTEVLKDDIDSKKNRKDTGFKSEKILSISDNISSHDLDSKCKQVFKWLEKKHAVRVTVVGSITNNKTVGLYTQIEEEIKPHGRIVQKRSSGNDLKFQIIPLKEKKTSN